MSKKQMKILVAEDDPMSLKIVTGHLEKWNYDVTAVREGKAAIKVLSKPDGPKMAVLDWMMPEMNGIEVCKYIKKINPQTYMLLLTSIEDSDAISTAILAGADDFVSKPFKKHELQARLAAGKRVVLLHESLSKANEELKAYATKMESLAKERAEQLIHAERLSALGILTAGIAHEINNPTAFISGNAQTLQLFWPAQEKCIRSCSKDNPDYEKLMFIREEVPKTLDEILTGTKRISTIVNGLKSFARQDAPKKIKCDIHEIIEEALLLCHNKLKYNVTIQKQFSENLPHLISDPQQMEQVFVNLFSNAADAMAATKEGLLIIRTENRQTQISVSVLDNGTGLSQEAQKKIFTPFFTTKPVGQGTGLGMSISQGIIENHGGSITAGNRPQGGACFKISLPL